MVPGRGLVKNVPKPSKPRVKIEPQAQEPKKRVRIAPIFTWNLAPATEAPQPRPKQAKRRTTLTERVLPNGASVSKALFDDPPF